jgi:hypothetical protein
VTVSASLPPLADLTSVVERINRVPDAYRNFTVAADSAALVFGVKDHLMRALLDSGLPHRRTAGQIMLDRLDLENIGLDLRLVCPHRTAMRWWSRTLQECDRQTVPRRQVDVALNCPAPGHPGPCRFWLNPRLVELTDDACTRIGPDSYRITLQTKPSIERFGAPFEPLFAEVGNAWFHLLPAELTRDLGFFEETGLADCRLAMHHFARVGQEMGLPVRCAAGIFTVTPYPVTHCWLELRVDDAWVAADPFLINAFHRWGIIDPASWPLNRSPQAVLWPVANDDTLVLATHNGEAMSPKFSVPLTHQ